MDIKMWLRSRASNTRPSASTRSTQVLPELAEGDLAKLDLHDPEAKFWLSKFFHWLQKFHPCRRPTPKLDATGGGLANREPVLMVFQNSH
jgi:hypothetical protein